MKQSSQTQDIDKRQAVPVRGFWLKTLGVVLLLGSVGLVSCQALFNL